MKVRRTLVIRLLVAVGGVPIALFLVVIVGFYATFYVSPRANDTIVSSGLEREYLLYVPAGHESDSAMPLVISLHGAALWPAAQMELSGWNEVADDYGFAVVYPSGRNLRGGGTGLRPKVWHSSEAALAVDARFIADLIDEVSASFNIDPNRIYANGFSNGGRMTFTLSCRLADRIAAVGIVAGAQDLPWDSCLHAPPVPLISFHGLADPLVRFDGRESSWLSPRPLPSVRKWTGEWAARNGCGPSPSEMAQGDGVQRTAFQECRDGADVVLYTIAGGGHTWPGGNALPKWLLGATASSISATDEMWKFFRAHPLVPR